MAQKRVADLDHFEHEGQIRDLKLGDGRWVTYKTVTGREFHQVPITRFGMGQLLKFADLKKSEAKEMDINDVVAALETKTVVFKRTDERVLGVVSPDFQDIGTNHVHHTIKRTLERLGLEIENIEVQRGLVTRAWYRISGLGEEFGLKPGFYLRNSVFGASALGISKFYHITDNGARLNLQNSKTYKKYHVGDDATVHDEIEEFVEETVDNVWSDVHKVRDANERHFPKDQQVDVVLKYRDNKKITKEMAGKLVSHIEHETWTDGQETLWSFVKTILGFAKHGRLSDQNRKRLESMAEDVLEGRQKTLAAA